MIKNITVRPFNLKKDLTDALDCFNEGFRHIMWPFIDHASPDFHLDCIRCFYKMSKESFVAEIEGKVHGILLGAAPFKIWNIITMFMFVILIIIPKVLTNRYKFNSLAYKHLFQCLFGFSFFIFLHPASLKISEITLFTSKRKYRGMGMGRKLMDAYIETVNKNGLKEATVCTDTSLSYHFYESYGFKIIRTFKMRAYKYSIPEESFTGLIYGIETDNERGHQNAGICNR